LFQYDSDLAKTFWRFFQNITNFNMAENSSEDILLDKGRSFLKGETSCVSSFVCIQMLIFL